VNIQSDISKYSSYKTKIRFPKKSKMLMHLLING